MKREEQLNLLLPYAVAGVTVSLAIASHGKLPFTLLDQPKNIVAKQYAGEYDSFHSFYLKEHRDPTCRVLHVIGTSLVIATAISKHPHAFAHLLVGVSGGLILCEYLSPLPNGGIEFVALFVIAGVSGTLTKQKFPWQLLLLGYLPAWIGHTFFEHNVPATFIYPTYSLISDFRMWFQMCKGDLPWTERI